MAERDGDDGPAAAAGGAGIEPVACALCGRAVPPQARYIVRIDVFADPSLPDVGAAEIATTDYGQVITQLVEELKQMSPEDAQDQVHRRFEYSLCPACHRKFLKNPLGKPRETVEGRN